MLTEPHLFNADALLNRIAAASLERPIMFVLGSPLTSPAEAGAPGVPGVDGIIDLVRERLRHVCDIDPFLSGSSADRYQQALEVLKANREDPTHLIRRAVLMDRLVADPTEVVDRIVQRDLNSFDSIEHDTENWHFGPGLQALGKIIAGRPEIFGKVVLTSNFDPLIEISVRCAGGLATSIGIDSDATPEIVSRSSACRVIHFHGFWSGSGTLHRPDQLKQNRPQLLDSICGYLRDYTCFVIAYGGWDDIFMEGLQSVLRSRYGSPAIFWAYFHADPEWVRQRQLPIMRELDRLAIARDGFTPYYGINVNTFLPRLFDRLGRPGPYRLEVRIPSPDEKAQLPRKRVVALVAAQDEAHEGPQFPDSLWGIDRGRFLGLLNGSADKGVYESLVQTEGRIHREIRGHPEFAGLPVRWWLRLDALRLTSKSDALEAIQHAVFDAYDPRFQYMRSKALPPGVELGVFLEMPRFTDSEEAVDLLSRCVACIERAVGSSRLLGIVAQWLKVSRSDFGAALEKLRRLWHALAVDGLNQTQDYAPSERARPDRGELLESSAGDRRQFLGAEARVVEMYARGKLSEEVFLREHGIKAFALALRRGLEFPNSVQLASQVDLSCTDFWWLVTKLEPTPLRLRQLFSLTASRRAVWGLCSVQEWNSFEGYVQAQILDARQGRALVLK
jgi:hypothetical protein